MKRVILLVVLIIISIPLFSQVNKFRAVQMTTSDRINGEWQAYRQWDSISSIVTIDLDANQLSFTDSLSIASYDIVRQIKESYTSENDTVYTITVKHNHKKFKYYLIYWETNDITIHTVGRDKRVMYLLNPIL
ncbi:hypothetical protein DSECCO2_119880 [anaerobic digester metagenome]